VSVITASRLSDANQKLMLSNMSDNRLGECIHREYSEVSLLFISFYNSIGVERQLTHDFFLLTKQVDNEQSNQLQDFKIFEKHQFSYCPPLFVKQKTLNM
jgi:hypothetical protein